MDRPSTSRDFHAPKRPRFDDSDNDEEDQLSEVESSDFSGSSSDNEDETIAGSFTWRNVKNFTPTEYDFDNATSGISPLFDIMDTSEECEYFMKFFDEELMQFIANETNKYYKYCATKESVKSKRWIDTTVIELYVFFALVMLMPHIKKHRIKEYWSKDEMIQTDFFSKYMTRDRFMQLLRYVHFADNTNPLQNEKVWKIRYVVDNLTTKFSTYFYPFQKLVIDESLLLFKGRLHFKQYIPSKRHRFGVKTFVLCDCESGMVLDLLVYTGAGTNIVRDNVLGFSGSVVKHFIDKYENKGHILYTDNWYSSPNLAKYLHEKNIGFCGTVKRNRKNFPKFPKKSATWNFRCES